MHAHYKNYLSICNLVKTQDRSTWRSTTEVACSIAKKTEKNTYDIIIQYIFKHCECMYSDVVKETPIYFFLQNWVGFCMRDVIL